MHSPSLLRLAVLVTLVAVSSARAAETNANAAGLDLFERKIRPVLAEKCYKCHAAGAEKVRGGLLLDTREGMRRGGDNGPAVVPGKLEESLLIEAVRYANKDFAMPPKKAGGKLPDDVIKDFEKWVALGAPDPRETPANAVTQKQDYGKAKDWWAWQTPQPEKAPALRNTAWAKNDLDRFVLAGLEAKGLQPVGDADKLALLRRVYFDLIGLPPSTEEIKAFYADQSPDAYEKLVDRLLASPQFGERWGRHWLDVARYAESSGKDANIAFPHAWRYRDYVIASFNEDKPYNEFIREQLAGDLLPAKDDREKAEHIVATGFLALGTKGLNEKNPTQFVLDEVDEQIDATSEAFLGLTVACARCHDHKFDPVPQQEYYSLAGIFLSTETKYGTPQGLQNLHSSSLIELPKNAHEPVLNKTLAPLDRQRKEEEVNKLRGDLRDLFTTLRSSGKGAAPTGGQQLRLLGTISRIGLLEKEIENYNPDGTMKALAMGVQDLPPKSAASGFGAFRRFGPMGGGFGPPPGAPGPGGAPGAAGMQPGAGFPPGGGGPGYRRGRPPEFANIGDSPVYARGDADKPGEKTPRGFLSVLTTSTPPKIPANSSGRLQLADWIASSSNPLTARVIVNRAWHWIFGQGLVSTPDNFGTTGNLPSNQALLDTLAVEFAANGWSIKKLVREIVVSHTYRLSSSYDEKNFAADPENTLLWRMSKRRLDAECIRDAILATSGELKLQPSPGSVIAYTGDGPIAFGRGNFGTSEESVVESGSHSHLRSVYLPIARDLLPDALAVFDFSEPSLVSGSRESTNVPSQALYLLNSSFVAENAKQFAARVLSAYPGGPNGGLTANLEQRVVTAYWMAFARGPSPSELRAASDFFTKFPGSWKKDDAQANTMHSPDAVTAGWTSFCRALFASAEFRYLN